MISSRLGKAALAGSWPQTPGDFERLASVTALISLFRTVVFEQLGVAFLLRVRWAWLQRPGMETICLSLKMFSYYFIKEWQFSSVKITCHSCIGIPLFSTESLLSLATARPGFINKPTSIPHRTDFQNETLATKKMHYWKMEQK